ncbi:ATP-binding cassette domain-containing protein [Pseudomonas sp.]|uniref:quaternary amine ABC transporter ATP-binding protein n=1 Tax=Pseudomonas sp. TaxID=306 RepID=UPI00248A625C|nr:ATP-binding cassette domain-containing protein [Pseudomonas sp.]MDI1332510.1 ATP-binding cassette domain-containing protein [Pseudomonas sp.]
MPQIPSTPAALVADNVWKVFGTNAKLTLDADGVIDADRLAAQGGTVGVQDASFSVAKGEIFMLMGLSGSGKSTLLRCLTGLYDLSHGNVRIGDLNVASASQSQLRDLRRHEISMVFQNFALLPHLTVLDNVTFPLKVQGVSREERYETGRRILELVSLKDKEKYYPHELSGGQQQRVGIARSLATDPAIWFLDEPFSALDPLIRKEMQNEFIRLQSSLQKTIVFVTHDFDEAVRLGDRIALMRNGVIVQIGTPEELVLAPADDYVRSFVRGIPKERVVTLRGLLEPLSDTSERSAVLDIGQTIESATAQIIASDLPIAIKDSQGRLAGQVSRAGLSRWMGQA